MNESNPIFDGEFLENCVTAAEHVVRFAEKRKFRFMTNVELDKRLETGNGPWLRAYWHQILMLSHCAGLVALSRQWRWHCACEHFRDELPNYPAFCASLRGFLECTTDMIVQINSAAPTLAGYHREVREALTGKATEGAVVKELGEHLAAFLRLGAEGDGKVATADHQTESYLKSTDYMELPLQALYAELARAAPTAPLGTRCFFSQADPFTVTLRTDRDAALVNQFCDRHRAAIDFTQICAFTAPLILLKTLNQFPFEEFHTPIVDDLPLDDSPMWQTLKTQLES